MGPDYRTDLGKIKKALDGALKCARKIGARRIALPAFGTGIGNTPAADVAPLTLGAVLRARKDFDEVLIVVFNGRLAPAFRAEFAKLAEKYPG
jgi:O-acetyl-ADP-ribose deacetylase (regulator of RNase III)